MTKPQRRRDTELIKKYSTQKADIKKFLCLCVSAVLLIMVGASARAQSTNQNFPTPATSNEISGTIRARDIGDARLTSYFYAFNANQGDVFINVVTNNLDGDIDVFTADGLRPLTKIRLYSDNPDSETGRVVYLRQPTKLILRIEGKTPTDDPATFRIKFAGSFQPAEAVAETEDSKQPEVSSKEETDVRVNSVGTIIEIKPKPTPTPRVTTAKVEKEEPKKKEETEKPEPKEIEVSKTEENKEKTDADKKPEVVVTENTPPKTEETEAAEKETPKPKKETRPKKPRTTAKTEPKPEKKPPVAPVDPAELANIKLVVDFKDGRKIERPMSEILKFGVDKGILTIIAKDGSIGRFSMLDIAKITIE